MDFGFSVTCCFITREFAQSHIDSLKKPIWKTEDGYDVFEDDFIKWVIRNSTQNKWRYVYELPMRVPGSATENPETYRVFKDEDRMNKWIDEQNRPKFQKGEWIYCKIDVHHYLMRFSEIKNGWIHGTEQYMVNDFICAGKRSSYWDPKCVNKATPQQIENILTKVAIQKGFKEGVSFKWLNTGYNHYIGPTEFKYDNEIDMLYQENNDCIYIKGNWASIIGTKL